MGNSLKGRKWCSLVSSPSRSLKGSSYDPLTTTWTSTSTMCGHCGIGSCFGVELDLPQTLANKGGGTRQLRYSRRSSGTAKKGSSRTLSRHPKNVRKPPVPPRDRRLFVVLISFRLHLSETAQITLTRILSQ